MNKKSSLKNLTPDDAMKAYQKQLNNDNSTKDKFDWSFYKEREFTENLLTNRFNFLLVAYAFFLTIIINMFTSMQVNYYILIFVLGLGFLVTSCLNISIYKIYIKVDALLRILHSFDDDTVFPVIEEEIKGEKLIGNANKLIGVYIPKILQFSFLFPCLYILYNLYKTYSLDLLYLYIYIIVFTSLTIGCFFKIKNLIKTGYTK